MEELKFEWEYCHACAVPFVRCPKCGNNSCNAGKGAFTKDGKRTYVGCHDAFTECDMCDKAYEYQSNAYKCKKVPARETIKGGLNVDIINTIVKSELWRQQFADEKDKDKIGIHQLGNIRRALLWNLRDKGLTDEEVRLRVNSDEFES